ncbi:hypothetical protein [Gordonibacter urolithinfaciens]|uniref:Uncharacterized protein n=1 Tax=Gordonibacter urolithinfaciens TaxID=1335613 RepID=A0A423UHF3_9ACTN|nr:hypothetical protein [Gordonibacter urolithinfaciens]ROT88252.1 hypothetical protein DMP12_12810 [Gordonibacter urolithinfaciens]
MAVLRADFSLAEKAFAVVGAVALFGGFGALMYGEFAPSVGIQGLVDRGIGGIGFLAMGIGVLCFVPPVLHDPWRARPRTAEGRRALARETARQAGVVVLNLVCYAGTTIFALGALTALGRAPLAAGAAIALCVAVFALYRRHRQKHRCTYGVVKPFGIVAFMLAFGAAAGAFGALRASDAVADAIEGPREQRCLLSDFEEQRPSGRYASARSADLVVEFVAEDGETVRVSVKEQDRDALRQIADAGDAVRLAYYPRTEVFVSARPAHAPSPQA